MLRKTAVVAVVAVLGASGALAQKGQKTSPKKKPPPEQAHGVKPAGNVAADVAALEGPDGEQAAGAAARLAVSKDGHQALLDALASGLAPSIAATTLTLIGAHPDAADPAVLAFYAHYRDPDVRAAAAGALGGYDDPVATRALVGALSDEDGNVRAAAAHAAGEGRIKAAVKPMLALLGKGDASAAEGLAAMADVELAKQIGELLGQVPDDLLAQCLGGILMRADFGPDTAKVEVVHALGKVQGAAATAALQAYVAKAPANRKSRQEADAVLGERGGSGGTR